MRKRESLIGKTFGRLTVLDEYKVGKYYKCWCQCSCGKQHEVYSNALKAGKQKSCGCYTREYHRQVSGRLTSKENIEYAHRRKTEISIENMVGKQFGYLTVLRRSIGEWHNDDKYPIWVCQCKCGKIIYAETSNLHNGNTTSCGCKREKDLLGLTFGKLKVIEKISVSKWLCVCECGAKTEVTSGALLSGHAKSCGCSRSKNERQINQILTSYNIDFSTEYSFEDLKIKNTKLRFDTAIFSNGKLKCLIEYQGEQHLPDSKKAYGKYQREVTDQMKKDYCEKNNIPLFYIWFNEDIKESINKILNQINMPIPCCENSVTTISNESTSSVEIGDGSAVQPKNG